MRFTIPVLLLVPVLCVSTQASAVRAQETGAPATSETRGTGVVEDTDPMEHARAVIVAEGPQAGLGERVVLGAGASLAVEAEDPMGGETVFEPILDDTTVELAEWRSDWELGDHLATGTVTGASGLPVEVAPLAFVYDTEEPDLDWETGGPELLEERGLDQGVDPRRPRRADPVKKSLPLFVSADGRRWLPLVPKGNERGDHFVVCDDPQVFLYVKKPVEVSTGDAVVELERGDLLRIGAGDRLSAVSRLEIEALPDEGSDRWSLRAEAVDLVGNRVEKSWTVARR